MNLHRIWTSLALVSLMAIPAVIVTQQGAQAAGAAAKAEWRPSKAVKTAKATATRAAAPATKKTSPSATSTQALVSAQAQIQDSSPSQTTATSAATPSAAVPDQSQDVLDVDFAMASSILSQGPKDGYTSALSDEGILYDANGASPVGREAATSRFGSFPADVKLVRTPERALAAGGSGSSWGTYTIKRGETILSAGRYISVWRREVSGWKMISELAAGKTFAAPPSTPIIGALPKRPTTLGRAPPSPVGVPLTVPIPPVTAPTTETPPAP